MCFAIKALDDEVMQRDRTDLQRVHSGCFAQDLHIVLSSHWAGYALIEPDIARIMHEDMPEQGADIHRGGVTIDCHRDDRCIGGAAEEGENRGICDTAIGCLFGHGKARLVLRSHATGQGENEGQCQQGIQKVFSAHCRVPPRVTGLRKEERSPVEKPWQTDH
ncbi:hypothetical protein AA0323_2869 [Asaia siamensis NRIC 0323]|nr:hypothetical protein AA0323_2869 [Asaia siamensis NRIC 0323]